MIFVHWRPGIHGAPTFAATQDLNYGKEIDTLVLNAAKVRQVICHCKRGREDRKSLDQRR